MSAPSELTALSKASLEDLFRYSEEWGVVANHAIEAREAVLAEIKLRITAKENQLAQLKAEPIN